jgi:hypothetical protein
METEVKTKHQKHQPILVYSSGKHVDTFFNSSLKVGDLTLEYGDNRRVMKNTNGDLWIDVEEYSYKKDVLGYSR